MTRLGRSGIIHALLAVSFASGSVVTASITPMLSSNEALEAYQKTAELDYKPRQ